MSDQPADQDADTTEAAATEATLHSEQQEEEGTVVQGASLLLVQAREKMGFSQKEVADKLFLTTTFIRYIDDGEFARIPKPAFIKGYLRSYARVVELSGDEIVALYEQELEAAEPAPEMKGVTEEKVGTASITGPVLKTGVLGIVGLAAIVAMIWWATVDEEEPRQPVITQSSLSETQTVQQVSEEASAEDMIEETLAQPTDSQSDMEPEAFGYMDRDTTQATDAASSTFTEESEEVADPALVQAPEADVVEEATQDTMTGSEAAESEAEQVEVPAELGEAATEVDAREISIKRAVQNGQRYIQVNASGPEQVELSFIDECWVEVSDPFNDPVYQDLHRDGDVLTLNASLPVRILLGKATAVQMIYNGRPFDLEPYTSGDDTAKLTISE